MVLKKMSVSPPFLFPSNETTATLANNFLTELFRSRMGLDIKSAYFLDSRTHLLKLPPYIQHLSSGIHAPFPGADPRVTELED
jgi:hypothetical protein